MPVFENLFVSVPILIILLTALFFLVLKLKGNKGIYFGWIPAFILLIITIFFDLFYIFTFILFFGVYMAALGVRLRENKERENLEK